MKMAAVKFVVTRQDIDSFRVGRFDQVSVIDSGKMVPNQNARPFAVVDIILNHNLRMKRMKNKMPRQKVIKLIKERIRYFILPVVKCLSVSLSVNVHKEIIS